MFITCRLTGGYQPSSRGNKPRSMKIMSGNFAMLLIVIKKIAVPEQTQFSHPILDLKVI